MTKFLSYYVMLLVVCLCFLPLGAEARQDYDVKRSSSVEVSWGLSIPCQNSFWGVDDVGFSTFSLRYEYRLLPFLGLGLQATLDYHFFEGASIEAFQVDNVWSDYAGEKTKEQILVPLMLSARYYPLGQKDTFLRPYLGLGVGTSYNRMYITGENINTQGYASWGFAVSPELGVRMHVSPALFADLRCSVLWSTDAWYSLTGDKSTLVFYPQLGVGFAF